MFNSTDTLEDVLVAEKTTDTGMPAELLVYNDDHNTFQWVIECFVDVLSHSRTQSEQLAMIIHYKGKAVVKTAPHEILRPFKDALVERGLSAVIESMAE